jgi:hypothetical protein
MQCPGCGYEVDDTAVFCPQCRFQFREAAEGPAVTADTVIDDVPGSGVITDESIFEEPHRQETLTPFTAKELKQLEIQLLQPAVLVVLIISVFAYSLVWTVPFIPVSIGGLDFSMAGAICLACGLAAGLVFFFITRRSLVKFRYE